jgi:PBP1b-binding outer membrane lipoprotein LpoB
MEKIRKSVLLLLIVGLILCGCSGMAPEVIQVPMAYTPTNAVVPPRDIKHTPIYFASLEDQRRTLDQIGENVEKSKIVPAKASTQEVISSLEKAFKREFNRAGLNVVESERRLRELFESFFKTFGNKRVVHFKPT